MNILKTDIEGALIIEPKVFGDSRGYFFESFSEREFLRETGIDVRFVQDNESFSSKGTLRGMHFQKAPYGQAKLLRVVKGAVQDVAVDIRKNSPTFGKYVSVILSGENKRQFFIPSGFAHGFLVLEDDTIFQYKCNNFYEPSSEGSIKWNDPILNIEWKIEEEMDLILSPKDELAPYFTMGLVTTLSTEK